MAIVKKGVTAKMSTYGQRDLISGKAVDKHTVFRVASLSKGFTGLLAATMTQDSLIGWDAPLCKWLPEVQFQTCDYSERLQLQHLLTHTTGLPRHTYSNLLDAGRSYENILSLLPLVEPAHAVGTYHSYQNVMFNLAGDMLAAAAGTSFERLITKEILRPTGMSNASVTFEAMQGHPNRALPSRRTASGYAPDQLEPDYYAVPAAAGVNASIYDMAKYLKLTMGYYPEVVDSTTLQQAYQPRIPIPAANYMLREWRPLKAAHYGMGVAHSRKRSVYGGHPQRLRERLPSRNRVLPAGGNRYCHPLQCTKLHRRQSAPAFFRQYFQQYINGQPTT